MKTIAVFLAILLAFGTGASNIRADAGDPAPDGPTARGLQGYHGIRGYHGGLRGGFQGSPRQGMGGGSAYYPGVGQAPETGYWVYVDGVWIWIAE